MFLCPEWSAHTDAIAGHGQLPSSAVALALSHLRTLAVGLQLPAGHRPAGCTWQAAGWVGSKLSSIMLRNARTAWASGADGASTAAAIVAAAQLVHRLPRDHPIGLSAAELPKTAALVASLPGHLCSLLCHDQRALARQNIQQRRLVAAQLLPAVGRLPQLLELLAGGEQLTNMSDERLVQAVLVCRAANWELGLLGFYAQQSCVELISGGGSSRRIMHSAADVALWAQALSAALRCVPLLRALHSVLQTDTRITQDRNLAAELAFFVSGVPVGPGTLALERASTLSAAPPHASGDSARSAAGEALQALWALHTAQCRRVHYAATAGSPQFRLGPERVLSAVCVLSDCMSAAAFMQLNASVITPGKPMPPSR